MQDQVVLVPKPAETLMTTVFAALALAPHVTVPVLGAAPGEQ